MFVYSPGRHGLVKRPPQSREAGRKGALLIPPVSAPPGACQRASRTLPSRLFVPPVIHSGPSGLILFKSFVNILRSFDPRPSGVAGPGGSRVRKPRARPAGPSFPSAMLIANPRSDCRVPRCAEALQFGRPILDRRARSIQPTTLLLAFSTTRDSAPSFLESVGRTSNGFNPLCNDSRPLCKGKRRVRIFFSNGCRSSPWPPAHQPCWSCGSRSAWGRGAC